MEEKISTDLEKSIFRTVAWFSLTSYPLTRFEIWKWLLLPERKYFLSDVHFALEESETLRSHLAFEDGFVSLTGRKPMEDLLRLRHVQFLDAVRKYAKLKRVLAYFSALPAVRAVGACNTLAWSATRPESDIDLFVLVRPGTIWSTRLLLVAPFALLGMRPHTHGAEGSGRPEARDPFCFSFFATTEAVSICGLQLAEADPYLAYWSKSVVPVFDRDGTFESFHKANGWTDNYLPHAGMCKTHAERAVRKKLPALVPQTGLIERTAKNFQKKRFPKELQDLSRQPDSRVVISDSMLKFHANDRREHFRERLEQICRGVF